MLLVYSCESKVIYSLVLIRSSISTEYFNSLWAVVRVLEWNHYEVTPFSSVNTTPPHHTTY